VILKPTVDLAVSAGHVGVGSAPCPEHWGLFETQTDVGLAALQAALNSKRIPDWALSVLPSTPEAFPMRLPIPAKEPLIETLPLEERIRQRAKELYVERGNQFGSQLDDWLQAEKEIVHAHQDALIDEASEESFPASDPPAY
jgi:hypothetical protein